MVGGYGWVVGRVGGGDRGRRGVEDRGARIPEGGGEGRRKEEEVRKKGGNRKKEEMKVGTVRREGIEEVRWRIREGQGGEGGSKRGSV